MKSRKQISFDLDTEKLKQYYPKKDWRGAYKDIKKFMLDKDFEWRQGSNYMSKISKTTYDIFDITDKLLDKYPYLNLCIRDIIVANIGKEFNLNKRLNKNIKLESKKQLKKTKSKGMSI